MDIVLFLLIAEIVCHCSMLSILIILRCLHQWWNKCCGRACGNLLCISISHCKTWTIGNVLECDTAGNTIRFRCMKTEIANSDRCDPTRRSTFFNRISQLEERPTRTNVRVCAFINWNSFTGRLSLCFYSIVAETQYIVFTNWFAVLVWH